MDAPKCADADCQQLSEPTIPAADVVARWLDEDLSADAERMRIERADSYNAYISDPSPGKGPL